MVFLVVSLFLRIKEWLLQSSFVSILALLPSDVFVESRNFYVLIFVAGAGLSVLYLNRKAILVEMERRITAWLAKFINVEIWYWEELGWCKYRRAVKLVGWLGENGLGLAVLNPKLVWKYFYHNWVVWEEEEALPQPIVRGKDLKEGQPHPLDLISAFSDLRNG